MNSPDYYEQLATETIESAETWVANNEWETAKYELTRAAIYAQLAAAAAFASR